MHRTYPLVIPIQTNHGLGETRCIGPTRVKFATSALFAAGEPLRFAIALNGTDSKSIEVVGTGCVEAVTTEGVMFVVDASIEQTRFAVAVKTESSSCD